MRVEGGMQQGVASLPGRVAGVSMGSRGQLRAVILLAGSVRPSELSRSVGRSLLELPIEEGETVLDSWRVQATRLVASAALEQMPLRIMIDQKSREPAFTSDGGCVNVAVERDRAAFRGTGGILRDVCEEYEDEDFVLVASAGQILVEPLERLAQALTTTRGDVALVAYGDGTPGGLMLVRCGVLSSLRPIGFLDFKEQVLPKLAACGKEIRIVHRGIATGIPIRTLPGYISALRAHTRAVQRQNVICDPLTDDPLLEDWRPTFTVVEEGASVHETAIIHDSVVLAGASVGAGAVVVRSVVCPGAEVPVGVTVADAVVSRQRKRRAAA